MLRCHAKVRWATEIDGRDRRRLQINGVQNSRMNLWWMPVQHTLAVVMMIMIPGRRARVRIPNSGGELERVFVDPLAIDVTCTAPLLLADSQHQMHARIYTYIYTCFEFMIMIRCIIITYACAPKIKIIYTITASS